MLFEAAGPLFGRNEDHGEGRSSSTFHSEQICKIRGFFKYRGKTVVFRKPLFPGYVFLRLAPEQAAGVRQCGHLANLLTVYDQGTFSNQLADILKALEVDMDVQLAPRIGEGTRVRIKAGPLAGIEGWVLRLDFINQAAAVKVTADQLEEA